MENDDKTPDNRAMYLKPTRFDLVLDGVAVLLLLALWAIALGAFVYPDFYPKRFDQSGNIIMAIGMTIMGAFYYRFTRFLPSKGFYLFVKITEENIERQYRLGTRLWRFLCICFLVFFLEECIISFFPLETARMIRNIFFVFYVALFVCLCLWYAIRARMLR
jgi:hypothetical protein